MQVDGELAVRGMADWSEVSRRFAEVRASCHSSVAQHSNSSQQNYRRSSLCIIPWRLAMHAQGTPDGAIDVAKFVTRQVQVRAYTQLCAAAGRAREH
jgi:hypothetical protein